MKQDDVSISHLPYRRSCAKFNHLHVQITVVNDGPIAQPIQPDGYRIGVESAKEHSGSGIKSRNCDTQFEAAECESNEHSDALSNQSAD